MFIHTCAFGTHDPKLALQNASTFNNNNNNNNNNNKNIQIKVWTSLSEFPSDLPDFDVFSKLALILNTPYLQSILARVYALYSYGGLYIDDDMTSLKPYPPVVTIPENVLVLVHRDGDMFHEGIMWGAMFTINPKNITLLNLMRRMLRCCNDNKQITGHGKAARSIYQCLTKEFKKCSDPILLLPSSVIVRFKEEAGSDALILAGRQRYPIEHAVANLFRTFLSMMSGRQTELLYRFMTTIIIGLLATTIVATVLSKFKKDKDKDKDKKIINKY